MKNYIFFIIILVLQGCNGQHHVPIKENTIDFFISEPIFSFYKKYINNENLFNGVESYKVIKSLLTNDYPNCYIYKKPNDNSWVSFVLESDYGLKIYLLYKNEIYEVASYEGDGGNGTDSFSKWIKNENIIVKSITKYRTEYHPNDIEDTCGTIINYSRKIVPYYLE